MKNQKKKMETVKGITLIALVVTIVILLILSGVTISTLTNQDGIINQAVDAKFKNTLSTIEEQINVYKYQKNTENFFGIDSYPIEKKNGNNLTLKGLVGEENIEDLPNGLKDKLLEVSKPEDNQIYGYDDINYDEFYKIDEEKIPAAGEYPGKLILYVDVNSDEYKVLHIDGIKYSGDEKFIIIPWDNQEPPVFVTTTANTYKLSSDGVVKVVGQLNSMMRTDEENEELSGLQELRLQELINEYGMATNLNVETDDEIAKSFGLKRILFNYATAYVIDAKDELWAWGVSPYNKLGQGNSFTLTEPTKILEGRVGNLENIKVKRIYVAQYNTCVIDTENRVWICGRNDCGGLGQGNYDIYDNYVRVSINGTPLDGSTVKEVLMSDNIYTNDTFILLNDGRVFASGHNGYGEFGLNNTQRQANFIELTALKNADQVEFIDRTIYVRFGNELYACGNNQYGNIIGKDGVSAVKTLTKIADDVKEFYIVQPYSGAGFYEGIDGKMYILNYSYLNDKSERKYVAQKNSVLMPDGSELLASNVTEMKGNWLLINGEIYVSSRGKTENGVKLMKKNVVNGGKVTSLLDARNNNNNYVYILKNGKIYINGLVGITRIQEVSITELREVKDNVSYMYGVGSNFVFVDRNNDVWENLDTKINDSNINGNSERIIASRVNKYVLTRDGRIYSKGDGLAGGWGDNSTHNNYTEMKLSDGTEINNVKDIYSGSSYTFMFLTEDNDLYFTGHYYYTLPNMNMNIRKYYPEKVQSNVLAQIKDKIDYVEYLGKSTGGGVTYIVTTDGELYTIAGDSNLSGNGKVTADFEKLELYSGAKIKDIETYNNLTLAVTQNGEVYGWGYNTHGILGDEYEVNKIYKTPVKLNLPSTIKKVEMGDGFAIFITTNGDVYGIGKNEYGQLGTGDTISTDHFVRCVELEK